MLQKVLKPAIEVLGAQNIAISIMYFRPTKNRVLNFPRHVPELLVSSK
jgi:hypothetical protein